MKRPLRPLKAQTRSRDAGVQVVLDAIVVVWNDEHGRRT